MSISAEETERRLRRLAQMRNFYVTMRREAKIAHANGKWSHAPVNDIRSDVEYWQERLNEHYHEIPNMQST